MLAQIWHLIMRLFGLIDNPVKQIEDDAAALPDDEGIKFLPPADEVEEEEDEPTKSEEEDTKPIIPPKKVEPKKKTPWQLRWEVMQEMLDRPFDGPLSELPVRRYTKTTKLANGGEKVALGVYDAYGRAPKETGNKKYPKAKLKVHEDLPGKWNKNRPRLYMEVSVGEYFREGLSRCGELEERISEILGEQFDVLSYMYSIGAFSHRHIRHNKANQLSYHSWALAFDQNAKENRGVTKHSKWQRKVKKNGKTTWVDCTPDRAGRGPVDRVMPYSKQFYEVWPKAAPLELFIAFTSVGFCCGMNWGRMKWLEVVKKHGVGYDQNDPKIGPAEMAEALKEWSTHSYYDGMHYELTQRGSWAKALWNKQQAMIEEGLA
jgi:hypothetical protein